MKLYSILALASIALAQDSSTPNYGYEKLLDLQKGFWEKFRYPNNLKEAQSINSTVFSEDVQGRVSDTRNFLGRELNTEYIFGLFIPTPSISIIGQPIAWEITKFSGNQNIAAASTRVNFTFPSFNNMTAPVVIDTWFTWNEKEEISQYDVTFRWFGYLLQTLMGSVDEDLATAKKMAQESMAESICSAHGQYCNGTNTQYESREECKTFLTEEIRMGESWELGMNTLLCRNVHEIMVKYRPDVHCSHIGRSGGGMCDDSVSYFEKVQEEYFTNAPWLPTQF